MPTTTGISASFSSIRMAGLSQLIKEPTMMEINTTRNKKLVPHLGWNRRCGRIFSTVRGSPAS